MKHRVVVVGGGFAGLYAVRGLARAPVEVTLVDRRNFHLFQPLAYQVATGALSPAEIAAPLRAMFKRQANVRVLLAEMTGVDLERRQVVIHHLPNGRHAATLAYDTLIVAGGSHYSYVGHDEWREHVPELKSLEGALDIRSRVLTAFEAADRPLAEFPESLSRSAVRALEHLGVTPLVAHRVVDVRAGSVAIRGPAGEVTEVEARTVIWAAGVTASSLAATLAQRAGRQVDRAGRVEVEPDLTLPGTLRCSRPATWSACAGARLCPGSRRWRCSRAGMPPTR
jgi:NADH:ubiquinone reductase (H+-translocating)